MLSQYDVTYSGVKRNFEFLYRCIRRTIRSNNISCVVIVLFYLELRHVALSGDNILGYSNPIRRAY